MVRPNKTTAKTDSSTKKKRRSMSVEPSAALAARDVPKPNDHGFVGYFEDDDDSVFSGWSAASPTKDSKPAAKKQRTESSGKKEQGKVIARLYENDDLYKRQIASIRERERCIKESEIDYLNKHGAKPVGQEALYLDDTMYGTRVVDDAQGENAVRQILTHRLAVTQDDDVRQWSVMAGPNVISKIKDEYWERVALGTEVNNPAHETLHYTHRLREVVESKREAQLDHHV